MKLLFARRGAGSRSNRATVATGRNNRNSSDSCDGDTEDDRKNGNTRTRHKVRSDKRHFDAHNYCV